MKKNDIILSAVIQIIVFILALATWLLGLVLKKSGYFISAGLYIIALSVFFYLKAKDKKTYLVSFITSLATGLLIGSFISRYSLDIMIPLQVGLIFIGIAILVHLLLAIFSYKKFLIGFLILGLLIVIIFGFVGFNSIFNKGLTLMGINYLFILIGMFIYLLKGKDMDVYYAGSLLWAFIAIFIVIIIVLSEGDALSGVDGLDLGVNPDKKKRKGK